MHTIPYTCERLTKQPMLRSDGCLFPTPVSASPTSPRPAPLQPAALVQRFMCSRSVQPPTSSPDTSALSPPYGHVSTTREKRSRAPVTSSAVASHMRAYNKGDNTCQTTGRFRVWHESYHTIHERDIDLKQHTVKSKPNTQQSCSKQWCLSRCTLAFVGTMVL